MDLYSAVKRQMDAGNPEFVKDKDLFLKAVNFNIDNVGLFYWHSERLDWNFLNGDFPIVTPPFPVCFFKYSMPTDYVNLMTGRVDNPPAEAHGFLVQSYVVKEQTQNYFPFVTGKNVHWIIASRAFSIAEPLNESLINHIKAHYPDKALETARRLNEMKRPVISRARFRLLIGADELGCPLRDLTQGNPVVYEFDDYRDKAKLNNEQMALVNDLSFSIMHPVFLALSLLHCKNTEVRDFSTLELPRSAARRQGRLGAVPHKYKMLIIHPVSGIKNKKPVGEISSEKPLSLHICRGHFKDFRNGKGLFGRYKGIYWWDSQIRGEADAGVIDKDYKVNTQ